MQLYWGDIHNHCGISYGYGSLENALSAAREQLDFCAVTGHAMWPDMPARTTDLAFLIDFHERGFAKLATNWDTVRSTVAAANVPGEFVTFQSYEMHSRAYGDHHVLSPHDSLPLVSASSPAELIARLQPCPAIAVPHHIGYVPGYRGMNWPAFDSTISPVVEIYSKHGSSVSDEGPYPYLHTMGPRDGRNVAYGALRAGHRFGFVASTDHHAGYPGSYGDGRVGVWAKDKSRKAIWQALLARHTYAVTGDKIAADLSVNGHPMGSAIPAAGEREITLDLRACSWIDKIILFKNGDPWQVVVGESLPRSATTRSKVRIEMGWGHSASPYAWEVSATVRAGRIVSAEPCFRGQSVLAPSEERSDAPDINALDNHVLLQEADRIAWHCETFMNPSTLHPATASVILEIDGDAHTLLVVEANGKRVEVPLADLCASSQGHHLKDYNSEALLIHRAVPEEHYAFRKTWLDDPKGGETCAYHAEIRQANGQCAWLTPVYVLGS